MILILIFVALSSAFMSPVFLDYSEFFMNRSNIVPIQWPDVQESFQHPVSVNSTALQGYDWTKPYPGSHIDGHAVYLNVGKEMTLSSSSSQNGTTVPSSLTFAIPSSMRSTGLDMSPLPMDPSWYVCRHIFISTKPDVKLAVDGGKTDCSFLSEQCRLDLKASLTENWGKKQAGYMCASAESEAIPASCQETFGLARQDVIAIDREFIANPFLNQMETVEKQSPYDWRIGTGSHDSGNALAYASAASRSYLVATVWGYSSNSSSKETPELSLACLSSGETYVPSPVRTTTASTMPPTPTSTQVPIPSDVNFYDDFSDKAMNKWKVYGGDFNASSGSLVASKSLGGKAVLNSNFSNFIFDADITLLSNSGNAGLIFRVSDPEVGADAYKGYYCGFGASGIVLLGWAKGDWMELAHAPANTSLNQIHHLKVVALAEQFYVYVNLEMHDFSIHITDAKYSTGMNGVRVWDTAAAFDNIRIKPFHFKPGASLDGY